MKAKIIRVPCVLVLQSAWLLGFVFTQGTRAARGHEILLETQPVDPRDLQRSDYLQLNYKISDVSANLFSPPVKIELMPGTHRFRGARTGGDEPVLRSHARRHGKFHPGDERSFAARQIRAELSRNSAGSVHVEYGLEQYFVAEGTGQPQGKLTVQAAVSKSGHASIKEVFVDGKPYAGAMKESSR